MILCIFSWGDPTKWKMVNYKLGSLERRSKTTKFIIEEYLSNITKNVSGDGDSCEIFSVVLVSDTLISKVDLKNEIRNYGDLKKEVKRFVGGILSDFTKDYYKSNKVERKFEIKTDIIVLPGTGTFEKDKWVFNGSARDWYAYGLIELYLRLLDCANKVEKVVIDVTHGLNYMTLFTEAMGLDISELLYVIRKGSKHSEAMKLEVFNSDPFVSEKSKSKLTIHRIKEAKVRKLSIDLTEKKPHTIFRPADNVENHSKRIINERILNEFRNIKEFISKCKDVELCWEMPLPLLLKVASEEFLDGIRENNFETKIKESVIQFFDKNIEVLTNNECYTIVRRLSYVPEAVLHILRAWSISYTLESNFPNVKAIENGLTVTEIERIIDLVYNEPLDVLAKSEISQLKVKNRKESLIKKINESGEKECLMRDLEGKTEKREKPEKRILLAHCGLQEDFVIVRYVTKDERTEMLDDATQSIIQEGDLYFKYTDKYKKMFRILKPK